MNMQLRRDEKGRPVGLAWPVAPEFTEEQVKKSASKGFSGTRWEGGRPRQSHCGKDGKGPHKFPENWRPNRNGNGGYCIECKRKRAADWREANRDKVKQHAERYRKKQRNGG